MKHAKRLVDGLIDHVLSGHGSFEGDIHSRVATVRAREILGDDDTAAWEERHYLLSLYYLWEHTELYTGMSLLAWRASRGAPS